MFPGDNTRKYQEADEEEKDGTRGKAESSNELRNNQRDRQPSPDDEVVVSGMRKRPLTIDTDLDHCHGSTPTPTPGSSKRRRNMPGTPDPTAEVVSLSPETLLATNRFVCEVCGKGFQRDQNLQLHRRGHNLPWKLRLKGPKETKKKVFVCPEPSCIHHDPSRALGDLTGIKKHYSRKHGERKFKCDKCDKLYAVLSDCKAHMKTCGTKEYHCDCGILFSRRDSFVTHRAFCESLHMRRALMLSTGEGTSGNNEDQKVSPITEGSSDLRADLGAQLPPGSPDWSTLRNPRAPDGAPRPPLESLLSSSDSALLQYAALLQQQQGPSSVGLDLSSLSNQLLARGVSLNDLSALGLLPSLTSALQQVQQRQEEDRLQEEFAPQQPPRHQRQTPQPHQEPQYSQHPGKQDAFSLLLQQHQRKLEEQRAQQQIASLFENSVFSRPPLSPAVPPSAAPSPPPEVAPPSPLPAPPEGPSLEILLSAADPALLRAAFLLQQNSSAVGQNVGTLSSQLAALGVDVNDVPRLSLLTNLISALQQAQQVQRRQNGQQQRQTQSEQQPAQERREQEQLRLLQQQQELQRQRRQQQQSLFDSLFSPNGARSRLGTGASLPSQSRQGQPPTGKNDSPSERRHGREL